MRVLRVAAKLPRWCRYAWPHVRRSLREPRYGVAVVHAGWSLWREGGWRAIEVGIATSRPAINDYGAWVRMYDSLTRADVAAIRRRCEQLEAGAVPTMVVPFLESSEAEVRALGRTLASLRQQIETRWRAVIVVGTPDGDDSSAQLPAEIGREPRVTVVRASTAASDLAAELDRAAALNAGLDAIETPYFAVLDPGDHLARHALYRLAEEYAAAPDAVLVYSDEDRLVPARTSRGLRRASPCFKPDWSPEHVRSAGGVGRLAGFPTKVVRELGGFAAATGDAVEFDLLLRVTESAPPVTVRHIPEVLVHREKWPAPPGMDHARAVQAHLDRLGTAAKVEPDRQAQALRTRYRIRAPAPSVSLVVPTRNACELLRQTVGSLFEGVEYEGVQLVVVDNGSDDAESLRYLEVLQQSAGVVVLRAPGGFNFAALCNAGVAAASGEFVALVNNDLVALHPDWLAELVALATQPGVGVVGARLWYPDGTLQHGGIVVGLGGVAGHAHKALPRGDLGHCRRAGRAQEASAVTGACLLMSKQLYGDIGGLDAEHLAVAFNDVDLCLRVQEAGLRVLWTPYAELVHLESATRGAEDTEAKIARFEREIAVMKTRWGCRLAVDPYYNPNLTLDREDFALAWPPRVAKPWARGSG